MRDAKKAVGILGFVWFVINAVIGVHMWIVRTVNLIVPPPILAVAFYISLVFNYLNYTGEIKNCTALVSEKIINGLHQKIMWNLVGSVCLNVLLLRREQDSEVELPRYNEPPTPPKKVTYKSPEVMACLERMRNFR